jgi:hypothetical protein
MKLSLEHELHGQLERLHGEIDRIAKLCAPDKLTPALSKSFGGYLKKLDAVRKAGESLLAQTFVAEPTRVSKKLSSAPRFGGPGSRSYSRVAKQRKHNHGL